MTSTFPRRRDALAILAAVALPHPAHAAGLRVATVDWSVLETLLALGALPVAAPELLQFREVAVEPAVPAGVTDLGLRGTVNFELLLLSRPELIYSSSFYVSSEPRLARIAPVVFPTWARADNPIRRTAISSVRSPAGSSAHNLRSRLTGICAL